MVGFDVFFFCNGPYSRDVLIVWGCIRLVGNLKDIPPFAKKKQNTKTLHLMMNKL